MNVDSSTYKRCNTRRATRRLGEVLALTLALSSTAASTAEQPNACENAGPISGQGVVAFDNSAATQDGPGHAACAEFGQPDIDRDVWYCWTASCSDLVTIETCGATSVDTKIAVYDGCACPEDGSTLLDCSDDACGLQSSVSFMTITGQSYLIRIGSSPGSSGGSGSFNISCAAPDEDRCDGPVAISGNGDFAFDNANADRDGPDHDACAEFGRPEIDHDLWYAWTAPCDGEVTLETCAGTTVDTKLAVYDSTACPPTDAELLDCSDDACGLQSRATFPAASGSTYLIRVGTSPGASGGSGSFNLTCASFGGGADNCASAEAVSAGNPIPFDNRGANTDGPGHALCLANGQDGVSHDVWFLWNAECSGEVSIDTCGQTTADTKLAVYEDTACPVDETRLIACNDDACGLESSVRFTATLGRDYLIRAGSSPGAAGGAGTFTISPCAPVEGGANSCGSAQPIFGPGTFDFDVSEATEDGPPALDCPAADPFRIDRDVWFDWTATCAGEITITSCGHTSLDTRLAVYSGTSCPPTAERVMDCNDDACGLQSTVTLTVSEGGQYLIRVGTPPSGSAGTGAVTISGCAPVEGGADSCVAAPELRGPGPFVFDNTAANQDGPAHPECLAFGAAEIAHDVWFCWEAAFSGSAAVTTCGKTGVDTSVAIYEGCGCAPVAALLACNDDACGLQSEARFDAIQGNTYLIRLGTRPLASGGTGVFRIGTGTVPTPLAVCSNAFAASGGGENGDRLSRFGCVAAAQPPAAAVVPETAIRVTLKTMYNTSPGDPDGATVCPAGRTKPSLSQFEGQTRWLGAPSALVDDAVPAPPDYLAAPLRCTSEEATVRDWTSTGLAADFPGADENGIYFYGSEVVPCSVYEVSHCGDPLDEGSCSDPVLVFTSKLGDCWPPFSPAAGQPSFIDIGAVVAKFKSLPFTPGDPPTGGPPEWHALVRGNVVAGYDVGTVKKVDFIDIGKTVDGFKSRAYTEDGPCDPDTGTDNCGNPCSTAP